MAKSTMMDNAVDSVFSKSIIKRTTYFFIICITLIFITFNSDYVTNLLFSESGGFSVDTRYMKSVQELVKASFALEDLNSRITHLLVNTDKQQMRNFLMDEQQLRNRYVRHLDNSLAAFSSPEKQTLIDELKDDFEVIISAVHLIQDSSATDISAWTANVQGKSAGMKSLIKRQIDHENQESIKSLENAQGILKRMQNLKASALNILILVFSVLYFFIFWKPMKREIEEFKNYCGQVIQARPDLDLILMKSQIEFSEDVVKIGQICQVSYRVVERLTNVANSLRDLVDTVDGQVEDYKKINTSLNDELFGKDNELSSKLNTIQTMTEEIERSISGIIKVTGELENENKNISDNSNSNIKKLKTIDEDTAELKKKIIEIINLRKEYMVNMKNVQKNDKDLIKKTNDTNLKDTREIKDQIVTISEASKSMKKNFIEFKKKISTIQQGLTKIDEINIKTNILALNAQVEAAKLTGNSEGFTVIAGEVKSLALQTKTTKEEISKNMDAVNKMFEDIEELVENTNKLVQGINKIAEENFLDCEYLSKEKEKQGEASEGKISPDAKEIRELIDKNRTLFQKLDDSSKEIEKALNAASGLADKVDTDTEQVNKTIEESIKDNNKKIEEGIGKIKRSIEEQSNATKKSEEIIKILGDFIKKINQLKEGYGKNDISLQDKFKAEKEQIGFINNEFKKLKQLSKKEKKVIEETESLKKIINLIDDDEDEHGIN